MVHQGLAVEQLGRGVLLGWLGAQAAGKSQGLMHPLLVGPQVLCCVKGVATQVT